MQGWTDRTCAIGHRDQKQTHMGKLTGIGKPDLQYPLLTVTGNSVSKVPTPGLPTSNAVKPGVPRMKTYTVIWVLGPHLRQHRTHEGLPVTPLHRTGQFSPYCFADLRQFLSEPEAEVSITLSELKLTEALQTPHLQLAPRDPVRPVLATAHLDSASCCSLLVCPSCTGATLS